MAFILDDFLTALGREAPRAVGLRSEVDVRGLGAPNIRMVLRLLGMSANDLLVSGPEAHADLLLVGPVREFLEGLLEASPIDKPILPRLRAEFFHPGDEVAVYVDAAWHRGRVLSVVKSQKREWSQDLFTRGFYWRVTALLSDGRELPFSTTEPRVQLRPDYDQLVRMFDSDLRFLAVFCENADRDWPPIWEIEQGHTSPVTTDFVRWLHEGRLHPMHPAP